MMTILFNFDIEPQQDHSARAVVFSFGFALSQADQTG
jgi:hypothetical protein